MAGDKDPLDILDGLLARVKKAGGDAADAGLFESASIEVAQRLGAPEKLERSESTDIGLRVFVGQRQAIVSSTDFSNDALDAAKMLLHQSEHLRGMLDGLLEKIKPGDVTEPNN